MASFVVQLARGGIVGNNAGLTIPYIASPGVVGQQPGNLQAGDEMSLPGNSGVGSQFSQDELLVWWLMMVSQLFQDRFLRDQNVTYPPDQMGFQFNTIPLQLQNVFVFA